MIIGEDRSKVQNIVKPNVPYFQKLYSNILQDCPQVVYKHHLGRLEASIFLLNIFKTNNWKCFITLAESMLKQASVVTIFAFMFQLFNSAVGKFALNIGLCVCTILFIFFEYGHGAGMLAREQEKIILKCVV